MNAAALFRDAARAHPERIAFYDGKRAITFAELWERVERIHARGRVMLMLPMSIDLYASLLGVLNAGGVAVFIDPWVGLRRMIQLARAAAPDHWVGTWKSQIVRLVSCGAAAALGRRPLATNRRPRAAAAPQDAAIVTFTTGSSGTPKQVIRTHRILIAQHERLAEAFPPKEGDVDLCTFPIFALNNLALGVTTIIPPIDLKRIDALDPQLVARAAKNATTATASPPLFDKLAALADRPRFRRILTGGAPVTDAQLRAWIAAWPDAEIVIAYGSSEAEPVAHIEARERLAAGGRGYLAGRIVNGVDAKLELIDDKVGELLIRGEHVASENEWHRMGDTGWFDEEGRFRIAGRVHSTIWRNGVAVHAQLVEQAARGDDARIRRVAAVGVNERLIVVIESDADVAEDVKKRVDADEVIVTREPLPVDPRHNSKIDYAKLREQLC